LSLEAEAELVKVERAEREIPMKDCCLFNPRWFISSPVERIKQEGGIVGIYLSCSENEMSKLIRTVGLMVS
jgi:hypothetical protein